MIGKGNCSKAIAAAFALAMLPVSGAGTGRLAIPQSDPASAQATISGEWSGHYLMVTGRKGRITLKIDAGPREVAGGFVLDLMDEERIERFSGSVAGRRHADELTLHFEADRGGSIAAWLRAAAAPGHATQALFGTVVSTTGDDFGPGVLIVWRYAEPRPE